MANNVFDTNILRALERPSAADLNQLQSQMYRTIRHLDRLRFGYDLTTIYSGFLNNSFFVQNIVGSGLTLNISRGVGYLQVSDLPTNIDGIAGLNDLSAYKPVFLDSDKTFTVPSDVITGHCRRDLLEVRWLRDLTDLTDLDIYDPSTESFGSVFLDKTMTTNLSGKAVDIFGAGVTPPLTAYLIYKKGVEIPYVNDDTFLSAPLPSVDSGCLALAAINVKNGDVSIPNSRIADLRKLLGNADQFMISGTATVGSSAGIPGTVLSGVSINAPAGVRCNISKVDQYIGATPHINEYQFNIYGPQIAALAPTFNVASPIPSDTTRPHFPIVTIRNYNQNMTLNTYTQTMVNSGTYSSPAVSSAIGQNYSYFKFTLMSADYYAAGVGSAITNIQVSSGPLFSMDDPTDTTRQIWFTIMGKYA